jgi:hypothetical protein
VFSLGAGPAREYSQEGGAGPDYGVGGLLLSD